MTLEVIIGNTGKEQLYVDENLYYRIRGSDVNNAYWSCIFPQCNVSVTTKNGVILRKSLFGHIGHEDVCRDDFLCRKTVHRIKERVRDELNTFSSVIFNEEVVRLQAVHGVKAEAVALYMKPYSYHKSTFDKIREKIRPPLSDFENFDGDTKRAYTLTVDNRPFLRYDNRDNINRMLIFISDHGLRVLGQATRWHTDGTFHAAPKPFMQLYILHGYDQVGNMIPCGYVLLQRKDKKTYVEMLSQLKRIADEIDVVLNPKELLADFEVAVHSAFKFIWPEIRIKGCFFHFRQATCRWIFARGYKSHYTNNVDFKLWCRKIGALALVPIAHIQEAWCIIKETTPSGLNVLSIVQYFEKTWLRGQFPPSMWNHFEPSGPRTNNHVESFNAMINRQLSTAHPNMWKFITFIKTQDNKMTLWLLQQKQVIYYIKKTTRDHTLQRANEQQLFEKFTASQISLDTYLGLLSSSVAFDSSATHGETPTDCDAHTEGHTSASFSSSPIASSPCASPHRRSPLATTFSVSPSQSKAPRSLPPSSSAHVNSILESCGLSANTPPHAVASQLSPPLVHTSSALSPRTSPGCARASTTCATAPAVSSSSVLTPTSHVLPTCSLPSPCISSAHSSSTSFDMHAFVAAPRLSVAYPPASFSTSSPLALPHVMSVASRAPADDPAFDAFSPGVPAIISTAYCAPPRAHEVSASAAPALDDNQYDSSILPTAASAVPQPPCSAAQPESGRKRKIEDISAILESSNNHHSLSDNIEPSGETIAKRSRTCWLTGSQIENHIARLHKENAFCLPNELATNIIVNGKSTLKKRALAKFRYLYGVINNKNHWTTMFVDINNREFVYIDPFGTTSARLNEAFANWLKFVELRRDLQLLHSIKPFSPLLIQHPLQQDDYNCGVFVCKFVSMLLRDENISFDSFDPVSAIAYYRKTISGLVRI